ncbi:hypothetical protein B9Z65_6664 [Elsinoe australis]|uniref:Uncharacterized protein n=1 Tax=Elsinoe australis TaxID=40998 RepID=A0A2P8ADV9_9PEZI|nr:hypothetical protein B9Z65_6664 [Elsinoe australis]
MASSRLVHFLLLVCLCVISTHAASISIKAKAGPKILNPSFEKADQKRGIAAHWMNRYISKGTKRIVDASAPAGKAYMQLTTRYTDPDRATIEQIIKGMVSGVEYTLSGSYRIKNFKAKSATANTNYGIWSLKCGEKKDFRQLVRGDSGDWQKFAVNVKQTLASDPAMNENGVELIFDAYSTGDVSFSLDIDNLTMKKAVANTAPTPIVNFTLPAATFPNPSFEKAAAKGVKAAGWSSSDKGTTTVTDGTAQSGKSFIRIPFTAGVPAYTRTTLTSPPIRNMDLRKVYSFTYYVRTSLTAGKLTTFINMNSGTGKSMRGATEGYDTLNSTTNGVWRKVETLSYNGLNLNNKLEVAFSTDGEAAGYVDVDSFVLREEGFDANYYD